MRTPTRRDLLLAGLAGGLTAGLGRAAAGGRVPPPAPHHPPRARALIHLHMAGGPSQLDLFDPKPVLSQRDGEPTPDSLFAGKRFAFLRGNSVLLGSPFEFRRHGQSGAALSELLPHLAREADRIAFVRSLTTTQFNHAPAQLTLSTGSPRFGRPCLGSWLSWALGSANPNLPAYVVFVSGGKVPSAGASLWSAGFLPAEHQGLELRGDGGTLPYGIDPAGVTRADRRRMLDALADLDRSTLARAGDPHTAARMHQYELAYRMQTEVPQVLDLRTEDPRTLAAYGARPGESSFANHCLLARRMIESGVRVVQLFDWGWDHHGSREGEDIRLHLPGKAASVDRPCAALLADLAQRGLLDDTLVLWTGEFGRTPMRENRNLDGFVGRDHQPEAATAWLAGGGVRPGVQWGETDELGALVALDPVEVFDLQATVLWLFGFDHLRLTYLDQGRDFRLTDVAGRVVHGLLA